MAARRRFFQMTGWDALQHYSKRNPPWIKTYTNMLSDYDYCQLSDASKAHVHGLRLLAAKTGNRLPYDREWLKKQLSCSELPDLVELQRLDFIEPYASKLLALERERGREREDQEPLPPSAAPVDNSKGNGQSPSLWDVARRELGGSYLGRLLREFGEPAVEEAIVATLRKRPAEWKSYLTSILKKPRRGKSIDQLALEGGYTNEAK